MEYKYLSDARSQAQINANRDGINWTILKTKRERQLVGLLYTIRPEINSDYRLPDWRQIIESNQAIEHPLDEVSIRISEQYQD